MEKQAVLNPSKTRKFLPLIFAFSVVATLTYSLQSVYEGWDLIIAMRNFMGAFFLVFGLFKVVNWKGFVDAYQTYDVLAKRSRLYAYVYPIVELVLAVMFIWNIYLIAASAVTFVLMAVSSIGVIQVLRRGEVIPCACLGAVFKVPMTKVTLAENVLMGLMALGISLMLLL